jgi:sugar phosphate isomerase/epimerase
MDRRKFLKNSALTATAFSLFPAMACKPNDPKTGLILYTVRDLMNENPAKTLDMVAALGYNWLEAAGYAEGKLYNMKPNLFKQLVEERGMQLISGHNSLNEKNLDEVINTCAEAGLKYTIMPSLPKKWNSSLDGFKEAAEFLNKAGEKSKAVGIQLGFHNHQVEFLPIDNEIPFDIMVNNTDPENVIFEIDLAWIIAAGQSPVDYFKKYPGRFELWHIKDLNIDKKDETLGLGTVDFETIFAKVNESGMKYFFIEQDNCIKYSPEESIKISRDYLLKNIL